MKTPMVRKQIYLAREQDRKLKALAAARGCTEADIVRDALDRLPDPAGTVSDQLAASGLLASQPEAADAPSAAALKEMESEVETWLDALPAPLGLAEAVQQDRAGR